VRVYDIEDRLFIAHRDIVIVTILIVKNDCRLPLGVLRNVDTGIIEGEATAFAVIIEFFLLLLFVYIPFGSKLLF